MKIQDLRIYNHDKLKLDEFVEVIEMLCNRFSIEFSIVEAILLYDSHFIREVVENVLTTDLTKFAGLYRDELLKYEKTVNITTIEDIEYYTGKLSIAKILQAKDSVYRKVLREKYKLDSDEIANVIYEVSKMYTSLLHRPVTFEDIEKLYKTQYDLFKGFGYD